MPSASLHRWQTERNASLEEIENAHRLIGGSGRGRRYATQQINQAYAVLLSSQFQGFCRDLHSECSDYVADAVVPANIKLVLRLGLGRDRKLDKGNPNPGNIGSDFSRFSLGFWSKITLQNRLNQQRQAQLALLNEWRNAIAHQDFDPTRLQGQTVLRLEQVRQWRQACNGLAISFDAVMSDHLNRLIGVFPW